VIKPEFLGYR